VSANSELTRDLIASTCPCVPLVPVCQTGLKLLEIAVTHPYLVEDAMKTEDTQAAINKLRVHIKANPDVAAKFSEALGFACKSANLDLPPEFFERLVLIHQEESETFSVPVLPVGSQCGM
jgi:hypothetical protein